MSNHTPGHWFHEQYNLLADDPGLDPWVIATFYGFAGPGSDPIEANLKLCAAAPELLDALKWCIHQFQGDSGTGDTHWNQFPEYRKAKGALVKAQGEEVSK